MHDGSWLPIIAYATFMSCVCVVFFFFTFLKICKLGGCQCVQSMFKVTGSKDDNAPIHRARGVTECFDEYENDVSSHQISNVGISFGRMVFIPPEEFLRL